MLLQSCQLITSLSKFEHNPAVLDPVCAPPWWKLVGGDSTNYYQSTQLKKILKIQYSPVPRCLEDNGPPTRQAATPQDIALN